VFEQEGTEETEDRCVSRRGIVPLCSLCFLMFNNTLAKDSSESYHRQEVLRSGSKTATMTGVGPTRWPDRDAIEGDRS
jgi:hypothetical protein